MDLTVVGNVLDDLGSAVIVGELLIEVDFIADPEPDQHSDGHADGEADDVDEGMGFVFAEAAEGDGEIVSEHFFGFSSSVDLLLRGLPLRVLPLRVLLRIGCRSDYLLIIRGLGFFDEGEVYGSGQWVYGYASLAKRFPGGETPRAGR